MAMETPATRALAAVGVTFRPAPYDYDPGAERTGVQAAAALGVAPAVLFKTLMIAVDGRPACVAIPSDRTLSMKRAAAARGATAAEMLAPADAERLTGFHTGGISPFGQKKRHRVLFDDSCLALPEMALNGGKRGLILFMAPSEAIRAAGAITAPVTA